MSVLGHAVRRTEDVRLVTGAAAYVDDVRLPGTVFLGVLRSPFAHARLGTVDVSAARAMPGVVGAWTAADLPDAPTIKQGSGLPERTLLATDRVRFVGEAVAVVVAESRGRARDALDAIEVDYDPLPAAATIAAALASDATPLFDGHDSNVATGTPPPDDDTFFEAADVVVTVEMTNQRLSSVCMETRAVLADVTAEGGTVWASTQAPHGLRDELAEHLGIEPETLRVIAPEVGGGFGAKVGAYPEDTLACLLSRDLGRPVNYVETRMENMLATNQGRSQRQRLDLGSMSDGTLVAARLHVDGDAGGYMSGVAGFLPRLTGWMISGCYRIPKIAVSTRIVLTNATPIGAYRGAGRPEAACLIERTMDVLARRLDVDPAELRRRNAIPPDAFPYATGTGISYDSGNYVPALDQALAISDYAGKRAEQARRRAAGETPHLGIGVVLYVEICAFPESELGAVTLHPDGTITVLTGTSPHGQGHQTAWAQLVNHSLGVPMDAVTVVHGDTARVPTGGGTMGSRSAAIGGAAVSIAAEALATRLRERAAERLEAAPDDIVLTGGEAMVAGSPATSVSLAVLTGGDDMDERAEFSPPATSFPFGAHVCTVEVEPETGEIRVLDYVAIDDCGRVLNPLLVEGQLHGGIMQGASQALYEGVSYDEDGTPRTSTLVDYQIPSIGQVLPLRMGRTETPTPNNALGVKGVGESGTMGGTPSVLNAVHDALAHLGVQQIEMPLTPQKVWEAVQACR